MQIKTWQQIMKWKIMFKQPTPALWLQKYSKVIKKALSTINYALSKQSVSIFL